ncbi:MAG: diguanylate cyclase [Betaproteobacteria bacterium]|nr:diguanylate cyclase [Betaproteobacteria bacterium]MCL2887263.1 diguanylate cyclase [Betaproteobacteria bacterium]
MAGLPRILVVDDSRVIRQSLVQQLKNDYEVREEGDGEAAWQTLVLDHAIRAVISDLNMPKLNGYQLLENVRSSKQRRLQRLPFILLSGEESEEERLDAQALGVSEFITKGTGYAELLTRLKNLLALSEAKEDLEDGRERMIQDTSSGLFTRKYLEVQAAQALSHAARHQVETSALVIGFDDFSGLAGRLGASAASNVANSFARMLAGKIRHEDSLGHFGNGQFAIVSPGTPVVACCTFAERVRQAVEIGRLAAGAQNVTVTVSIGIASVPRDVVDVAGALLDLAGQRMRAAMAAGGNRIDAGGVTPAKRPVSINRALELLAAGRPEPVLPYVESLGQQLLPLLRLIDAELGLALPLANLERRLGKGRAPEK